MNRTTGGPVLILALLGLASPLSLHAAAGRPLTSFPAADLKEPAAGADVLFVVSGDNRPTAPGTPMPRVVGTIFEEIGLIRPDFVLWTGDTIYGYCESRAELEQEYTAFLKAAQPIAGKVPLYNSPGNHEIHTPQTCKAPADQLCGAPCSEDVFRSHFGTLYGSFDYAGAHFIALDTADPQQPDAITGDQLTWLKEDLESHKEARAIFVFSHTEFYSSPLIDTPDGNSHPAVANRWELQDLFRRYPVKAVFSGHEHLYWREPAAQHDGIDYFIAGGAGAPLYASPDRGGFSHYVVVRLTPDNKLSYELIEPGRLFVEDAPAGPGEAKGAKLWIVNSNDLQQPLPLRGVDMEVPASLGRCDALTATAQLKRGEGWTPIDGAAVDTCTAASGGKQRVHLKLPPLARGSVQVTVRRKG
jgi:hypothetical protein